MGLETWLMQNSYRIPAGANELLRPYIRQGMKFFVAKVNLEAEFDQSGFQKLRPLQIAYESSRFMLPIRLGMMNAQDAQDLVVYLLSPSGQTELTNYRTVKIPLRHGHSGVRQRRVCRLLHGPCSTPATIAKIAKLPSWNMPGICAAATPAAADPLTYDELRKAGVFWITPQTGNNVFVTRLHVRYTRDKFP
jgi:hypothetical protein